MGALFEKCEQCDGTRKLVREVATGRTISVYNKLTREVYPIGFACPFCSTGYHEIGMTARQLEVMHEERDKLLEFVARVAECRSWGDTVNEMEADREAALMREAAELVKGKMGRVEEYRARKGLNAKPSGPPSESVPPQAPTG